MPRHARKKSSTGIYHIMLRGINRQRVFDDREDRDRFLETLKKYKEQCGYTIYAYCIMGNHVHLLMKEGREDLVQIFKRIAGSYVYWYNWKYDRCGHLFQDRFKSEPVEDDSYFLTVLRYIHQNPVKAKLCQYAEEYSHSSMQEYLGYAVLTDTDFALSIIDKDEFIAFHRQENEDQCLDIEESVRLTDEEAKKLIRKTLKCNNIEELQNYERDIRNLHIAKLYQQGLSVRQISRLTGLSRKIVELNCKR